MTTVQQFHIEINKENILELLLFMQRVGGVFEAPQYISDFGTGNYSGDNDFNFVYWMRDNILEENEEILQLSAIYPPVENVLNDVFLPMEDECDDSNEEIEKWNKIINFAKRMKDGGKFLEKHKIAELPLIDDEYDSDDKE